VSGKPSTVYPIPLRKKLFLWSRGFYSKTAVLHNFDENDVNLYLSNFSRIFRTSQINQYSDMLWNKLSCHFMLQSLFKDVVPVVIAAVSRGKLVGIDIQEKDILTWTCEYLQSGHRVFAKPIEGSKGKNAKVISTAYELRKWIVGNDGYMLCELIESHPYSSEIFPHSLNTIRILSIVDDSGPYIVAAVHRFGNKDSAPVDNWSSGGLAAPIDLDSGILSEATMNPVFTSGDLKRCKTHPDTGAVIEGAVIPNWPQVCRSIARMAEQLAFLPYLGWDIAIAPDGGFRVVEINSNTDINILQIAKPLLSDERLRRFYEFHRVI
jgi:hypothetical protein